MNIAEKDLADLAFNGLRSHIKNRLEGYDFFIVTQVHQRALAKKAEVKSLIDIIFYCACFRLQFRLFGR